ncbi:unnamed protein product, partial [Mesorhabditis belari]|uniref:STAS domain-containing protein n=1 Tax=Mesorhabditis belari TaxID=2138241 RepID=A0AAF3EFU4_9BILA
MNFWQSLISFIPILQWLPKYSIKHDFLCDMIGGITTGVMHVPQGIAYSVLAGVPPVNGLYSSCFPDFFYMIFGTSKYASIGSFAVVALLAGVANTNVQESLKVPDENGTLIAGPYSPVEIAMTLTFAVGIVQFLCGLLHLQFLTAYFSDALVSGFTTGAAAHVLIEQFDDLLGVKIPKYSGPGYIFRKLFALFTSIPDAKVITLITSTLALLFLYIGKEYLSPFLKRRFGLKFPIPYELILMSAASGVSFLIEMNEKHGVPIVANIPIGVPFPSAPILPLLSVCFGQALPIALVATAVHISMAKMLAKQHNQKIDSQQELYALGMTSLLGGLFPVYPVSTALGRTMVNVSSGTRTQLSTVFSCLLLLTLILWLGPLIEPLPMCILAAIITVALKGMFMKCAEVKALYKVSKLDTLLWFFSFLSTLCIDVVWGLGASIAFALITLIIRTQWPHWHHLIHPNPQITSKIVSDSKVSLCVHRFDAPLIFANVERFRKTVDKSLDDWIPKKRIIPLEIDEKPEKLELEKEQMRILILDFSTISYIDHMGVKVVEEVAKDLAKLRILVYLSGFNENVLSCLRKGEVIPSLIPLIHCFPTLRDAIDSSTSPQLNPIVEMNDRL